MIKNILFDFDGVILDSMPIRDFGFRKIFKEYDNELVEKLIEYHNINGGLSRFVKIKYFYKELLGKSIDEKTILNYADKFSQIMKEELVKKKYLIQETVDFIQNNHKNYNFHIVSGSEEKELNYLCEKLGLSNYFITIGGSPTAKTKLVRGVLIKFKYKKSETILIGDSINDYEASKDNNIEFYGYNNLGLEENSKIYIKNFNNFNVNDLDEN